MAKAPKTPVERTAHENNLLDMLGEDLSGAVKAARDRLGDETIMARIGESTFEPKIPGLVAIERGAPSQVLAADLDQAGAITFLTDLT